MSSLKQKVIVIETSVVGQLILFHDSRVIFNTTVDKEIHQNLHVWVVFIHFTSHGVHPLADLCHLVHPLTHIPFQVVESREQVNQ